MAAPRSHAIERLQDQLKLRLAIRLPVDLDLHRVLPSIVDPRRNRLDRVPLRQRR